MLEQTLQVGIESNQLHVFWPFCLLGWVGLRTQFLTARVWFDLDFGPILTC